MPHPITFIGLSNNNLGLEMSLEYQFLRAKAHDKLDNFHIVYNSSTPIYWFWENRLNSWLLRGKEPIPSACIPWHSPLVALGVNPWGKLMVCGQSFTTPPSCPPPPRPIILSLALSLPSATTTKWRPWTLFTALTEHCCYAGQVLYTFLQWTPIKTAYCSKLKSFPR